MKTIFKHKTLTALFSILVTLCMLIGFIGIGTTTAFAADTRPPHKHCSCGLDTDVCDTEYEDHHKDYLFPIWESDTRMPFGEELDPESSGSNSSPKVYYYLVHDVAMSDTWEIQNGGKSCNITICLYDHTITNENSNEETPVIELWEYGRLYLTTCGRRSMDGDAEITHTEGTFGSGVYVGRKTDNPKNDGYFYMYGGNIVRNASTTNGGGVWVKPKGKFEMYRGSISGNTAYGNGGGVYNTGVFNMYGGTISANNAQGQGDGVYNINIFNMTGGTISSTGVAIENTGTMTISGGTVSGSRGIRNVDNGTVKLSGNPTISSNSGTVDIECYSTNEGQIDADGYTGKTLRLSIDGTTDGQENFDLLMNKVIVKNATVDKFLLVDENGQPYMNYALVQEGNDLVLREHIHNYTYSANNNILTESCSCGHEKNATLSAPTGELVYNGSSFNASVVYDEGWVGEQPTISYTKNSVATSDTTGAGDYVAGITVAGATASVHYKIEKATPTDISWPVGLKGNAGDRLSTIVLDDGFSWITPNRVMDYDMMEAGMRYQPNANYNPVENSVSIEVDDDKDPTGTISIGDKTWSSFVEKENITFNTFFSEKQTVTITVDDGQYGSGVNYDEFGYYISTKKKSINELSNMTYDTWKKYTGAFEIKSNGEYIIYVRFMDNASNMTYLGTDGIVLDSKAPTISGITNGETYHGAVEATVSDTYFDRVEIGGVEAAVIDGKFTVNAASGVQEIIAYDKAGNTTVYTITVNKIKVTKPAADNTAFTYNGEEQTYTIAESELYTVTNNKREDAGMQKVTIVLKDKINYEWADSTTNDLEYDFNIEKATLGADIFDFTAPANLNACDGLAKDATVTVKEGIKGVGSVTVKYFKGETELTGAPSTVGIYTVKIEVAEGANYEPATLTDEAWTFTFNIIDLAGHTGVTLKSNENGTHDKFCTVCKKVFADGATCWYEKTENDDYLASPATCYSGTTYYKSCECGHASTDTFVVGYPDSTKHNWNDADVCSVCGAILISEKTFPDANFREYMVEIADGGDGILTQDEIDERNSRGILVNNRDIQSLKGLELFPNVTSIDYSNNSISHLDLSLFAELTYLNCSNNNLTSLDVSANKKLTYLNCSINNLKTLDVSANKNLTVLYCYKTNIESLDLSQNTALSELMCGDNPIAELDLSNNLELYDLRCGVMNLAGLDLSRHTKLDLEFLYVWEQQIEIEIDNTYATFDMNTLGIDLSRVIFVDQAISMDANGVLHVGTEKTFVYNYAVGLGDVVMDVTVTIKNPHRHARNVEGDYDCTKEYNCLCGAVVTKERNEHDFSGTYLFDAEGHYHKCNNCDVTDTKIAHTFNTPQKDSTEHWNKCSDCSAIDEKIKHSATEDGDCKTEEVCSCRTVVIEAKNDHDFDNACDTDCNNDGCTHTRSTEHRPEEDDDDCTTDILCSVCDAVTTKGNEAHTGGTATCTAKAECSVCGTKYGSTLAHTPEADDGDCTTAVGCSICSVETTAAKSAHVFDNDCTTADKCANCAVKDNANMAHTFDNDCTTADKCANCNAVDTAQNAHNYGNDDKCTVCGWEKPVEESSSDSSVDSSVDGSSDSSVDSSVDGSSDSSVDSSVDSSSDSSVDSSVDSSSDSSADNSVETSADSSAESSASADVSVDSSSDSAVTPPPAEKGGLSGGAIVGIAVASVAVGGVGGFSLVWFVFKKKTWAELIAIFTKK